MALRLPALEDANAIQVGLMRIQKALIEGTISTKTAGLLLYSMQLALMNVGRTTFGQVKSQELVRETVDGEEAFSQKLFTTEGTEGTEKGKTIPLMNADERGLESQSRPVEWKPSADMYRMDTREGIETYEASFRMKIAPRLGTEGRPVQREIAPNDRDETHAKLGSSGMMGDTVGHR